MQALLEIIAAIVVWGASLVLTQFGVEADFTRPVAPASAPARPAPRAVARPPETPVACPGQGVKRTPMHLV